MANHNNKFTNSSCLRFYIICHNTQGKPRSTNISPLSCLHKNANYIDLICKSSRKHTFRNGITNGLRGKLVASCSWAWNSSMDIVEFWNVKRLKFIQKSTYLYSIKVPFISVQGWQHHFHFVSQACTCMTLVWEGAMLGSN